MKKRILILGGGISGERSISLKTAKAVKNCIKKKYNPDIMVKGSDYKNQRIVGKEYCKAIEFYEINDGYSTTKKIQDIINRG